jgi:hypothetical protein
MSGIALIIGDRGQLALEILGYENPQSQSVDDSNWLRATLKVRGGPFQGAISFGLMAEELAVLHEQLADAIKSLTGTVRFGTMEGNWAINLDFERSGTAVITGTVAADVSEKNLLCYEFRADGITLEAVVRDLGNLVSEYPAKSII